jgi:hypothetical protein
MQQQKDIEKRHEEYQYLDLIRRILSEGETRPDRYCSSHPFQRLTS